jgi:hypothetical protein
MGQRSDKGLQPAGLKKGPINVEPQAAVVPGFIAKVAVLGSHQAQ